MYAGKNADGGCRREDKKKNGTATVAAHHHSVWLLCACATLPVIPLTRPFCQTYSFLRSFIHFDRVSVIRPLRTILYYMSVYCYTMLLLHIFHFFFFWQRRNKKFVCIYIGVEKLSVFSCIDGYAQLAHAYSCKMYSLLCITYKFK